MWGGLPPRACQQAAGIDLAPFHAARPSRSKSEMAWAIARAVPLALPKRGTVGSSAQCRASTIVVTSVRYPAQTAHRARRCKTLAALDAAGIGHEDTNAYPSFKQERPEFFAVTRVRSPLLLSCAKQWRSPAHRPSRLGLRNSSHAALIATSLSQNSAHAQFAALREGGKLRGDGAQTVHLFGRILHAVADGCCMGCVCFCS